MGEAKVLVKDQQCSLCEAVIVEPERGEKGGGRVSFEADSYELDVKITIRRLCSVCVGGLCRKFQELLWRQVAERFDSRPPSEAP